MNRPAAAVLTAFLAAGCAGGGGDAAASATRLTEICRSTTNMSAAVCDCVGKKAKDELSADALAFLVASMDKKEDVANDLKAKLSLEEMTSAGTFFVRAPAACANPGTGGK